MVLLVSILWSFSQTKMFGARPEKKEANQNKRKSISSLSWSISKDRTGGRIKRVSSSRLQKTNNFSFRKGESLVVTATAYSPEDDGGQRTALGIKPKSGVTIAVDPRLIPLGSKVFIQGFGWRLAQDTGGAIKGRRIDIFMSSRRLADTFGRRRLKIFFIKA